MSGSKLGKLRRGVKIGPPGIEARRPPCCCGYRLPSQPAGVGRYPLPISPRGSWFHWAVAGRAVKVTAILGLDKIKAFGKGIHVYVPSVRLRKPGCAGLSANGTPKVFNPAVWDDHRSTMSLRRDGSSQLGCHNQTDPTAWSFDEAHPPNG